MPFSWLRVSSQPSRKIKECMGSDHSKGRFHACATDIISASGGELRDAWFEGNGRWAHLHVYTDTQQQMQRIILDLEAEQAVELFSVDDMEMMIAERFEAD
jgi:hypothetical protein